MILSPFLFAALVIATRFPLPVVGSAGSFAVPGARVQDATAPTPRPPPQDSPAQVPPRDATQETPSTAAPAEGARGEQPPVAPAKNDGAGAVDPSWQPLDGVVIVVNEDILTNGVLLRSIARRAREQNVLTNEDRQRISKEVFNEAIVARLKTQAGEALGFDPDLVKRAVKDKFERIIRLNGGAAGLSKVLEHENLSADEFRKVLRDELFSDLWEDSVTGSGASANSRPIRDRFVRPGMLSFEYTNSVEQPGRMAQIGGESERVLVQRLLLDVSKFKDADSARALALQLRHRIVDGDDMNALVRDYSASKQNDGYVSVRELATLKRGMPEVSDFLAHAKIGEVSEVTSLELRDHHLFEICRMVDRTPGKTPPLSDAEVQKTLTKNLQKEIDTYRIDTALQVWSDGSYIWPPREPKTR